MSTPAAEIVAPGEQGFKEREAQERSLQGTDRERGDRSRIRRFASRWSRFPDFLMIGSIVTLVVLTSLPRLREFVVQSNETDARDALVRLVATDLEHSNFLELMDSIPGLRRRFQDGVVTSNGESLRYHGYCFAMVQGAGDGAGWHLLAWPELFSQSGIRAYCASSSGEFLSHPNPRGRWSGPEKPPIGTEFGPESGWSPWSQSVR